MMMPVFILLLCYLIGSIPFGLILTRRFAGLDIRTIGSGNIGATNVLRTGHKKLALATLLLDMSKSALGVALGSLFLGEYYITGGIAAVLGHMFPIFLKFRGGKGVASTIGMFLFAQYQVGVAMIFIWGVMAVLFRYSSLAAIITFAAAPVLLVFFQQNLMIISLVSLLCLIILYKHKDNIKRLWRHEESKIKF